MSDPTLIPARPLPTGEPAKILSQKRTMGVLKAFSCPLPPRFPPCPRTRREPLAARGGEPDFLSPPALENTASALMIPRSQRGLSPRPRPVLSLAAAASGLLLAAALPVAAQVAPQSSSVAPGLLADQPQEGAANPAADAVVVTATRLPVDEDESPAAITVISAEELAERQTDRVADALRAVPGISVSQSGAPGQLTSVFTLRPQQRPDPGAHRRHPLQPGTRGRV